MTHVLRALIPALWIAWLVYWVAAARSAKETQRRESARSRATHYVPLILGGVMLGFPNVLGAAMERRFHAHTLTWFCTGVALVALGLGFAVLARAWLGSNWSAQVTVKREHALIRSGPYALVRHPIYTGVLAALLGTTVAVDRWRALVGLVLIVVAFVRKMTIEERFMTEQFGEDYTRYRAEVPALIPFIV
jgi:protein-S-isoprenylcysteine O-methyltransferase Ste14